MSERDQGEHRSPVLMIVFIIRRANQKIKNIFAQSSQNNIHSQLALPLAINEEEEEERK